MVDSRDALLKLQMAAMVEAVFNLERAVTAVLAEETSE